MPDSDRAEQTRGGAGAPRPQRGETEARAAATHAARALALARGYQEYFSIHLADEALALLLETWSPQLLSKSGTPPTSFHTSDPANEKRDLSTSQSSPKSAPPAPVAPPMRAATLPLDEFLVEIDIEIADIAPGYLEIRRNELPELLRASKHADYAVLVRLGHNMKGSAGAYGFARLRELGALLERAAASQQPGQVDQAVQLIAEYIANVRIRFPEHKVSAS